MYIKVDLKVIEGLAASVAKASGTTEARIGWGLVRLWHRCWADEADHLDRVELAGQFGPKGLDAVIDALVSYGFLEVKPDKVWRVCGGDRYLRLKESRRLGGRVAARNLKRGVVPGSRAGSEPGVSREQAPLNPSSSTESPSHRVTESPKISPRKSARADPKPTDPRHSPMVAALCDIYREEMEGALYAFTPRDARCVAQLLALEPEDAALHYRWRAALRASHNQYQSPKTRNLADFVRDFNAYPVVKNPAPRQMRL